MTKLSLQEQKEENARKKHEDSIKYLYFSRYLMIRYIVTILLFANLFWLVFTCPYKKILGIVIATIMTIYSAIAAIEQLTKMHNRKPAIPITRLFLWIQLILNIVLAITIFTPLKEELFPFITTNETNYLILTFLLIGAMICIFAEIRINNIMNGKDRYLRVIKTFKKHNQ